MISHRLDACPPASPSSPGLILVGVCAAGKSTVASLLKAQGVLAHAVAQEHSLVPTLFQKPNHRVVYLAARWETVHRRRQMSWHRVNFLVERERLRQARRQAGLVVHTDGLTADEVAQIILRWFIRLSKQ